MSLCLKWTRTGRVPSCQGGDPIPYRKWTNRVDDPILCRQGWHACRWEDAIDHISDELWVVELDGPIVEGPDKVAGSRLRIIRKVSGINERTLRLFAADCAESVLHLYERDYPNDDRPRNAIEATRAYANGEIDAAAWDVARDVAWDAAHDTARVAAGEAARVATWVAARRAAGNAARVAAGNAARVAARAAALDIARRTSRVAAHDAAWDAAWDAARGRFTTDLLVKYGDLNPDEFAHRQVSP